MTKLHLIILLLSLADIINCESLANFDLVQPLLWEPVPNVGVYENVINYEIYYTFTNPCDMIPVPKWHRERLDKMKQDKDNTERRQDNLLPIVSIDHNAQNHEINKREIPIMPGFFFKVNRPGFPQVLADDVLAAANESGLTPSPLQSQTIERVEVPLTPYKSLNNTAESLLSETYRVCTHEYNHKWLDEIESLIHVRQESELGPNNIRLKRDWKTKIAEKALDIAIDVGKNALSAAASAIVGSVITNVVSSVFETLDPNSNTNRLGRIETDLQKFKSNIDIVQAVTSGLTDEVINIKRELTRHIDNYNHAMRVVPHLIWMTSELQLGMSKSRDNLRRIKELYIKKTVAVKELSELLNITSFAHADELDTRFRQISYVSPQTIKLEFSIFPKSHEAGIFKVQAFDWFDIIKEPPALMSYVHANMASPGHQDVITDTYIIYDIKNNCMKPISRPNRRRVDETCTVTDYVDPRLKEWKIIEQPDDIYATKLGKRAQLYQSGDYNYIYCFPFNITIKGIVQRCPVSLFRLPITEGWTTGGVNHSPKEIKLNLTQHHDISAIESLSTAHFTDEQSYQNDAALFDHLYDLRKQIRSANFTLTSSVVIERGIFWWIGTSVVSFGLFTAVSTCVYCCIKQGCISLLLNCLMPRPTRRESSTGPYRTTTEPRYQAVVQQIAEELINRQRTPPPSNEEVLEMMKRSSLNRSRRPSVTYARSEGSNDNSSDKRKLESVDINLPSTNPNVFP